ncbi:hypothetical protein SLS62_011313 [Diatrype stigma]|uniref:Beta-glucuronidase C-terminal domain-containing protein n=1 Tax=Diatrype stigma TaxID=117547 RepID=A0AAN9YEL6_9PEZI
MLVVMSVLTQIVLALAAIAGQVALAQDDNSVLEIDVPSGLATRRLLPDVYGYSIEPIWVNTFASTPKTAKLLQTIADVTGVPPPIRVGGTTADQTYIFPRLNSTNASMAALPKLPDANRLEITPGWFRTWGKYFPEGTRLIYTLNLAANESQWANAVAQAEAAWAGLGEDLAMFELGNEIDHFINKGWRGSDWGVETYSEQFRNLTGQITASDWYKQASTPPKFQAAVFADPPWVSDQQDEVDDFDIRNLTRDGGGGLAATERDIIGSYATHLYPQSTCDAARWQRMRLDLLSDHTTLWRNVSQYALEAEAADKAGATLVMGETNSVSCGGRSGISDTFGAALWGVDYVLMDASIGVSKTYFHLGAQSEYSSFTPLAYEYKNESLTAGIRPGWYAHYFLAKVVASTSDDEEEELGVAGIPSANSSSLSGYAVYSRNADEEQALKKLVFLDMGVWNGTEGLSNPSTLSVTDGEIFSEGERPTRQLRVATSWAPGLQVRVSRLAGPGTNAKSEITVSGVSFDPETGDKIGEDEEEALTVGENGIVEFEVDRAQGILLQVSDNPESEGDDPEQVGESGAIVTKSVSAWAGLAMGIFSGFALVL